MMTVFTVLNLFWFFELTTTTTTASTTTTTTPSRTRRPECHCHCCCCFAAPLLGSKIAHSMFFVLYLFSTLSSIQWKRRSAREHLCFCVCSGLLPRLSRIRCSMVVEEREREKEDFKDYTNFSLTTFFIRFFLLFSFPHVFHFKYFLFSHPFYTSF